MKRLLYRYFSEDYLHVISLMAAHFRQKRIRTGRCYAPDCQQDGVAWLNHRGIFCWDHYHQEIQSHRQADVGRERGPNE